MPPCLHQGQDLRDAVTTLSVELQMPDASQRQPLCEIIRDIEAYGPQLRAYFTKHAEDDHALAALAVVLSRLCVDPRLRSVVVQTYMPKDFLPALLREQRCQMTVVAGLQLASTILSGPSNRRYCHYVVGSLASILDTLKRFSSPNNLVLELALGILDRTTRYILALPASKRLRVALDLVERVRHLDGDALNAVLPIVFGVMSEPQQQTSRDEIKTLQSFCVGVFRASWPRARLLALRCIQGLLRNVEPPKDFNPGRFLQGRSTWRSSRKWSLLEQHGLQSCATLRLADQMEAFLDAVKGFMLTKDTRALALRMFSLIVQDPRSVWFDEHFTRKAGIGRRTPRQFGVPCDDWLNILLYCAVEVALLSRAELLAIVPQHLLGACTGGNVSNILILHHSILTSNSGEILQLCRSLPEEQLVSRHSFYAYALHTLPIAPRWEALLQELEAKSSAHSTLFTAALARRINRLYLSLTPTLDAGQQDDNWQSIAQRVYTVIDLCKKYMDLTPPDAPDRSCVEEIRLTLYLLVRHPDDIAVLTEIRPLLDAWGNVSVINEDIWGGAFLENTREVLWSIVTGLGAGAKDWYQYLRMMRPNARQPNMNADNRFRDDFRDDYEPPWERSYSKDELSRWRQRVFVPAAGDRPFEWEDLPRKVFAIVVHPRLRPLGLKRCSKCEVPTVQIRRCARCRVLYCGKECQLQDWGEHKLVCRRIHA